ncbi:MAG: ATP-dependent Clp protease adaptor ClpS [Candidatus Dadabacteria bacterium]|nr:ATP-dependent Clp protease adaptor ClpS [Candidatus Dadabacteria bacterium]NIT13645.1 ATP-dependent Clp protease adaptor ClpS [Candidatus Dadabacteria bacterium]
MHTQYIHLFDSESSHNSSAEVDTILEQITKRENNYNVVLLDDDDHTYDYVIEMLMNIFGHSAQQSYVMACEVDFKGRVIVYTAAKEDAEAKKDEILNFGPDYRLLRSKGSMHAIIEPAVKK